MSDAVVPMFLAKDWIPKLWKQWSTIRESRRAELEKIDNLFGKSELLAQSYIEPDCQRLNPADHHEEEPHHTFRQPVRGWLNAFLSGEFFERDGRNTLFVLSDAGMGKSSLLMMLKFSHMLRFWPNDLEFRLEKLGPETLATLEGVGNRGSCGSRRLVAVLGQALAVRVPAQGRGPGPEQLPRFSLCGFGSLRALSLEPFPGGGTRERL